MSDIALRYANERFDFAIEDNDLARDDGLETAIHQSLFVNRRAADDDEVPGSPTDRGGSWMDSVPVVEGDRLGSRLWLLDRSKATQRTLDLAVEYSIEALQWMIEDRVAKSVDVSADVLRDRGGNVFGYVIQPVITKPDGSVSTYRFNYTWAAQEAA